MVRRRGSRMMRAEEAEESRMLERDRAEELEDLRAENKRLRAAIRQVLADAESRPGGWGPDVTCVAILQAATDDAPTAGGPAGAGE